MLFSSKLVDDRRPATTQGETGVTVKVLDLHLVNIQIQDNFNHNQSPPERLLVLNHSSINPPSVATDLRGTHDISLDAPTPLINAESAPLIKLPIS